MIQLRANKGKRNEARRAAHGANHRDRVLGGNDGDVALSVKFTPAAGNGQTKVRKITEGNPAETKRDVEAAFTKTVAAEANIPNSLKGWNERMRPTERVDK